MVLQTKIPKDGVTCSPTGTLSCPRRYVILSIDPTLYWMLVDQYTLLSNGTCAMYSCSRVLKVASYDESVFENGTLERVSFFELAGRPETPIDDVQEMLTS